MKTFVCSTDPSVTFHVEKDETGMGVQLIIADKDIGLGFNLSKKEAPDLVKALEKIIVGLKVNE